MRNIFNSLLIVTITVLQINCAKRIPIGYNELKNNLYVNVDTKSGSSYKGVVKEKNKDFIVVQTDKNARSVNKIARNNIDAIRFKPPAYDDKKRIISEYEISEHQTNKNTTLYTIGGSGICFGASFFIGSLFHRNLSDSVSSSKKNIVLWSTTGVGTALGTTWFFKKGRQKDRENAIMAIRELRYEKAQKVISKQKVKKSKVQDEMEKIKAERAKQKEEIEKLREKLKKQKKKEDK